MATLTADGLSPAPFLNGARCRRARSMPQEEDDEASATDLHGGEKQRVREIEIQIQTQEVEKIDLGLGLGLGLVEYLQNRSPVPEMTRATQRRETD